MRLQVDTPPILVSPTDHEGSYFCLPTDRYNMRRTLRILAVMVALTLMVHVVIYYQESANHQYQQEWKQNAAAKLPLSISTLSLGNQSKDEDDNEIKPNPKGGGHLHTEISEAKRPFFNAFPKQVIILGYQRVGSSFFGQIFDKNPHFFYIYEPLDAVYTEMYGTRGGMNVPSDITCTAEGLPREVPPDEQSAVRQLLTQILACDVSHLPQEFLLHKYWHLLTEAYMPSWSVYRGCLKHTGRLGAREECREKHLAKLCPGRFGVDISDQLDCKRHLGTDGKNDHTPFGAYKKCLDDAFSHISRCVGMYERKCHSAQLWAVKTVRGTMDEMGPLLEANPNLRVIHLIRDPRPVVVSRKSEYSYRGIYSGNTTVKGAGDILKEASLYCGTVVRDLLSKQELLKEYPGKIVQVVYEDFIQNPELYVGAIYEYLDERVPPAVMSWIKLNTQGHHLKKDSWARMNAWKSKITFLQGEQILQNCAKLYDMLDYDWPDLDPH